MGTFIHFDLPCAKPLDKMVRRDGNLLDVIFHLLTLVTYIISLHELTVNNTSTAFITGIVHPKMNNFQELFSSLGYSRCR